MNKHLKLALRIVVSLSVSAFFVWLSLRKIDVRRMAGVIADVPLTYILYYLCIALTVHVIRTVRWGILLEPLGHVGFRRLNSAAAVGFMLLMVLPLRLGEFARPLLIARPPDGQGVRLSRSGALASVVVERIVDGIFMGLLGVIALWALGSRVQGGYADFARHASLLVSAGFFALCVALVLAYFLRDQALSLTRKLLTPLSEKLAARVVKMLDSFISALHLGSGWKALGFFVLTALYWSLSAFGLLVMLPAFGMHLSPLEACALLAIQVVGAMVPAGPGMVGTLSFFTQMGLSLFVAGALGSGQEGIAAAAFANLIWAMQFGQQVALGLIFMGLGHVSLKGLLDASPADDEEPSAA
ncbi:MAG: flippase-like domain-containing protein [Deltaproteobacteria bacterium]|nr:flippase-like domain-containing protein [Deltaproteobacteria bacterium]